MKKKSAFPQNYLLKVIKNWRTTHSEKPNFYIFSNFKQIFIQNEEKITETETGNFVISGPSKFGQLDLVFIL